LFFTTHTGIDGLQEKEERNSVDAREQNARQGNGNAPGNSSHRTHSVVVVVRSKGNSAAGSKLLSFLVRLGPAFEQNGSDDGALRTEARVSVNG
jgi:hypothetical protein